MYTFVPGMDGFIKMWYYGTVEETEITDEHTILEVMPMFEISVSDERGQACLLSIVKQNASPHDFIWFAQVRVYTYSLIIILQEMI